MRQRRAVVALPASAARRAAACGHRAVAGVCARTPPCTRTHPAVYPHARASLRCGPHRRYIKTGGPAQSCSACGMKRERRATKRKLGCDKEAAREGVRFRGAPRWRAGRLILHTMHGHERAACVQAFVPPTPPGVEGPTTCARWSASGEYLASTGGHGYIHVTRADSGTPPLPARARANTFTGELCSQHVSALQKIQYRMPPAAEWHHQPVL